MVYAPSQVNTLSQLIANTPHTCNSDGQQTECVQCNISSPITSQGSTKQDPEVIQYEASIDSSDVACDRLTNSHQGAVKSEHSILRLYGKEGVICNHLAAGSLL